MPIHIHWENDNKTLMVHEYVAEWSIDDFKASVPMVIALLRENTTQPIDYLVDLTRSADPPLGVLTVSREIIAHFPPNLQRVVMVVHHPLLRMLIDGSIRMFGSLNPVPALHVCKTLEEARAYLAKPFP
jgi:hypothetical protein